MYVIIGMNLNRLTSSPHQMNIQLDLDSIIMVLVIRVVRVRVMNGCFIGLIVKELMELNHQIES